jgi:hypothetical protein
VGSSHNRFTSAEGHEEASLLGCPPIGLATGRTITQNCAFYPRFEDRGFTAHLGEEAPNRQDLPAGGGRLPAKKEGFTGRVPQVFTLALIRVSTALSKPCFRTIAYACLKERVAHNCPSDPCLLETVDDHPLRQPTGRASQGPAEGPQPYTNRARRRTPCEGSCPCCSSRP